MARLARRQSGTGIYHVMFCCSSYKNKTTRTFEHCEEAWRVLVGAFILPRSL